MGTTLVIGRGLSSYAFAQGLSKVLTWETGIVSRLTVFIWNIGGRAKNAERERRVGQGWPTIRRRALPQRSSLYRTPPHQSLESKNAVRMKRWRGDFTPQPNGSGPAMRSWPSAATVANAAAQRLTTAPRASSSTISDPCDTIGSCVSTRQTSRSSAMIAIGVRAPVMRPIGVRMRRRFGMIRAATLPVSSGRPGR
jgi:hypothetical protein